MNAPIKELTWDERITWGECQVCHAKHGESCRSEIGLHMGCRVCGGKVKTGEGVHLGRLQHAPSFVRMVGCEPPNEKLSDRHANNL